MSEQELCGHGRGFDCVECRRLAGRPSVSEDAGCAICFESTHLVRINPCGHDIYCRECCSKLTECPSCRTKVLGLLNKDGENARTTTAARPRRVAPPVSRKRKPSKPIFSYFPKREKLVSSKKPSVADLMKKGFLRPAEISVGGICGEITPTGKLSVPDTKHKKLVFDTPHALVRSILGESRENSWDRVFYHPPDGGEPTSLSEVLAKSYSTL